MHYKTLSKPFQRLLTVQPLMGCLRNSKKGELVPEVEFTSTERMEIVKE